MPPQRSNLILTPNVPNIEFHVLVCYRLDVESDGWDRRDGLVEFELIQDGCD